MCPFVSFVTIPSTYIPHESPPDRPFPERPLHYPPLLPRYLFGTSPLGPLRTLVSDVSSFPTLPIWSVTSCPSSRRYQWRGRRGGREGYSHSVWILESAVGDGTFCVGTKHLPGRTLRPLLVPACRRRSVGVGLLSECVSLTPSLEKGQSSPLRQVDHHGETHLPLYRYSNPSGVSYPSPIIEPVDQSLHLYRSDYYSSRLPLHGSLRVFRRCHLFRKSVVCPFSGTDTCTGSEEEVREVPTFCVSHLSIVPTSECVFELWYVKGLYSE